MITIAIGVFIIFLIVLIVLGPRPGISVTIQPIDLPPDLDTYLAQKEKNIPHLIPGTEKIIIWAGKKGEQTPYSIIYIHGFSATRQETAPVMDKVAESLEANLFYTRLKGHGQDGNAMVEPVLNDWAQDVWEAYQIGKRIGNKVIVVGVSTGAPLAAWLCTRVNDCAALIFFSANFVPANKAAHLLLLPWGYSLLRLIIGPYHQFTPANPDHERYWTARYPSGALVTMMAACKLGTTAPLSLIIAPVLSLYTEHDKVISIPAIDKALARMGSGVKRNINVKEAIDHVMAGEIMSPGTNEKVITLIEEFLEQVL